MTYVMPTPNVGDYVSDAILFTPTNLGASFQVITGITSGVNSTTKKTWYIFTVASGTVSADQDYLVLSHTLANGIQYWVMGSSNTEQTGE